MSFFKPVSEGFWLARMVLLLCAMPTWHVLCAQTDLPTVDADDDLPGEQVHEGALVTHRRQGTVKSRDVINATTINSSELLRAACCNLGESFTTNPSVDVNYSDAATGAKQIRLLGLSGQYVQMLFENVPALRGPALPFALGYVPGPWLQSIQVSKGASSVKNGFESITGQINLEFLKPQTDQRIDANVFGDTKGRFEANAMGNVHLGKRWSSGLMLHYQDNYAHHDDNHDGFLDMPRVRQYNLLHRWAYFSHRYIMQATVKALKDERESGQTHHGGVDIGAHPFRIGIDAQRLEATVKNAFFLDDEQNANVALILSATHHEHESSYGLKRYDARHSSLYASLLFEQTLSELHQISAGLSATNDLYHEHMRLLHDALLPLSREKERESIAGAYVQHTLTLGKAFTLMSGLRADQSSRHGFFVTPRLHLKYAPNQAFTLRASVGEGFRSVHALAENNHLLASGRLIETEPLKQERAWNYGLNATLSVPVSGRPMRVDVEYYYTHFLRRAVIDFDTRADVISIANLHGRSYSHTLQAEVSYDILRSLSATAALRYNLVKASYGGTLLSQPLTNRYKALVTASYKPGVGLWQFDATLQLNGPGRLPKPYTLSNGSASWPSRYHAFEQLQAQVTRSFRHFDIYVGAENITVCRQRHPIVAASSPWSSEFEPTMIWKPVEGRMFYAGLRLRFVKYS